VHLSKNNSNIKEFSGIKIFLFLIESNGVLHSQSYARVFAARMILARIPVCLTCEKCEF